MTKREQFIKEFKDLLKKHDVTIEIEDIDRPYRNRDETIVVDFAYDKEEGIIKSIDLGRWHGVDCEID